MRLELSQKIRSAAMRDHDLTVDWSDGLQSSFYYVWLRDNCSCPKCCHANGQRLLEAASIELEIRPTSAEVVDDSALEITWADVEHSSTFSASWLRAHSYPKEESPKRLPSGIRWDAKSMLALPEASYRDVSTSDEALGRWLEMIASYGFAILREVPIVSGAVTKVVALFGYVCETNYGTVFEVESVADPNNVAYTNLPLTAHTDNPYRDPVPSLQLLHCMTSDSIGGDTTLVDGFRVAEALREQQPEAFNQLTTIPVRFRFQDRDTLLENETEIIKLDKHGEVVAIHFNNPTAQPFDFSAELIRPYYASYKAFAQMLEDEAFQIRFKLSPGDLYIVDNRRVLHGRTAFSGTGARHLQGCYADRDGLYSKLRVLNADVATTRGE